MRGQVDSDDRAPAFRTLALLGVVGTYLYLTTSVILGRLRARSSLWQTDYAIFRQAGNLVRHGELDGVYRYVPPSDSLAAYSNAWQPFLSHVDGYYYAQTPWHTVWITPFAFLDLETGFVIHGLLMAGAFLAAALLLGVYTRHSVLWITTFLAAPFLLPFLVGHPWEQQDFTWNWIALGGQVQHETVLGATLWSGQYSPLLAALMTGGFVAAYARRHRMAGLFLVLATMKPNVLLGVPLVLLLTDKRLDLIRWTAFWALLFNIVFSLVPFLGYPGDFVHAVFSYTDVFWQIILQAHNYTWMYAVIIATVALRYDAIDTPVSFDFENPRRWPEFVKTKLG